MLFMCDDVVKRCMRDSILGFLYFSTSLSICFHFDDMFCFDDMFYEFMKTVDVLGKDKLNCLMTYGFF